MELLHGGGGGQNDSARGDFDKPLSSPFRRRPLVSSWPPPPVGIIILGGSAKLWLGANTFKRAAFDVRSCEFASLAEIEEEKERKRKEGSKFHILNKQPADEEIEGGRRRAKLRRSRERKYGRAELLLMLGLLLLLF